jgi:hypothetical protein
MSVMRVFVFETPEPRAKMMKHWRDGEAFYKKAKRDKILKSYKLVETNDRWLAITEFETKAKMNKFIRGIADQRKTVVSDSGGQGWSYAGTVRGSG